MNITENNKEYCLSCSLYNVDYINFIIVDITCS